MTAPGSLERLPIVIAVACVVTDVTGLLVEDATLSPTVGVVLLLWAAADLALATPPRFTTAVVAAHAALLPVSALLLVATGEPGKVLGVGFVVAGYRAGAWLRARPAAVALGALLAGMVTAEIVAAAASGEPLRAPAVAVYLLANAVVPWLVGRYTTAFRDHLAELRRREERQVSDELAAVERALAQDRAAIARDLHDVLAHHVSAITVHAGAARLALPDDPATDRSAARRSVAAVEAAGRAATVDLRRLLDLLHGADAADGQPGIENLDELVDGVRSTGLDARLDTAGPVAAVPASVGVVVYRVVQEALTNALRHGSRGPTDVRVRHTGTLVTVEVTNPVGPRVRPAGAGRGLPGMRTRVGLFGGSLSAGPTGDGRAWEVRAELPAEGC